MSDLCITTIIILFYNIILSIYVKYFEHLMSNYLIKSL